MPRRGIKASPVDPVCKSANDEHDNEDGSSDSLGSEHSVNKHDNSAYIKELRSKFRPPSTVSGRAVLYIQTMLCKVEFLLGGYMLDTWETAIIYPCYLLVIALLAYGIYRQLNNGWAMLSGALGL